MFDGDGVADDPPIDSIDISLLAEAEFAFKLMANEAGAEEACGKSEALVEGIDMDPFPAITIAGVKFFTCDGGKPFDVDAIALSKSNCVREFDTSALGGALALGICGTTLDFGDGAEHIGFAGSARRFI